jgi:hypothetical protein
MQHKNQHWIPRSYLAAWCDPDTPESQEPYVWIYSRDGISCHRKAPTNIFAETDMYTIKLPGGKRDLRIEHGLSELESEFARIRRDVIEPRLPLTSDDRLKFLAFVAAMRVRTKRQRDHQRSQWTEALEMGQRMREAVKRMTPQQRKAMSGVGGGTGQSFTLDEVEELAKNPLQHFLPSMVEAQLSALLQMNLAILCTDEDPGFVTSDDPCLVHDPKAKDRPFPYNVSGMAYETVELVMPLSPARTLLACWKDIISEYVDLPSDMTMEANRWARVHCDKEFIVRRRRLEAGWFPPDPAPDS